MPNGVNWGNWDGGGGPLAEWLIPFGKGGGSGGGGGNGTQDGVCGGFGGLWIWGEDGKSLYGVLLDSDEEYEFLGDDIFDNIKEHEALDAILVEKGIYVTHGGGGGGGVGGGLKCFWQSQEHLNVCFSCLVLHGDCGHCVGKVESLDNFRVIWWCVYSFTILLEITSMQL